MRKRKTTAMKVESRDLLQDAGIDDFDVNLGPLPKDLRESGRGRWRHDDRMYTEPSIEQQALDDQTSFGDEQSGARQLRRLPDQPIRVDGGGHTASCRGE